MRLKRRQFMHLGGGLLSSLGLGCEGGQKVGPTPDPEPDPDAGKPWWLRGNFGPVDESEASALEVTGSIPASLEGMFLRNGPNPYFGESGHWFLGDGMVHGLRLGGGEASLYRARYVQTPVLGVDPAMDDGTVKPPSLTDHEANTSVVHHAGKLLALLEIGLPYELSKSDLSTVGVYDFGGALNGSMTAHPKVDPVTGEMFFIGYDVLGPYLTSHVVDATGALVRSEVIDVPAPAMMHDFQITESAVIFMFLPIIFSLDLAFEGDPFPFRWDPSQGARIGVMPRDGGNADVEWFDVEPCYVFHTFNAFDDPTTPGKVILDAVRYPQLWVESSEDFDAVGENWRWELTAGVGVTEGPWSASGGEFPRIDPRRQGRPYRYGYTTTAMTDAGLGDGVNPADTIAKYDVEAGTVEHHTLPDGMRMGEAVFIPASDTAAEDEGFLVGYTYHPTRKKSELVIVDARDLAAPPVARVALPTRVPYGFHGIWIPS
ncbi:MAG: carotenoid oxygenase family protein [Myxococcales bacterium]|nr:carotenoid oxygenase family protein [Myxococcales bacterium]